MTTAIVNIGISARCTACGACVATCPEHALAAGPKRPATRPERCTACLACVEVCPVDAIAITEWKGTR